MYDSEIGYCQGQSFLIAALLLQMPEEQAFGVLVEIMFAYGLRDLYRYFKYSSTQGRWIMRLFVLQRKF